MRNMNTVDYIYAKNDLIIVSANLHSIRIDSTIVMQQNFHTIIRICTSKCYDLNGRVKKNWLYISKTTEVRLLSYLNSISGKEEQTKQAATTIYCET